MKQKRVQQIMLVHLHQKFFFSKVSFDWFDANIE